MLEVLKNVVPSFNVAQNQISDASTFVRAPSLRGLAGDMTLVMINGKRLNRAALVQVAAVTRPTRCPRVRTSLSCPPSPLAACKSCAKERPRNTVRTLSPV